METAYSNERAPVSPCYEQADSADVSRVIVVRHLQDICLPDRL